MLYADNRSFATYQCFGKLSLNQANRYPSISRNLRRFGFCTSAPALQAERRWLWIFFSTRQTRVVRAPEQIPLHTDFTCLFHKRFVTQKALNKHNDYYSSIINNSNPSLAERLETRYKTPLFREADYQFQLSILKWQNKNRFMLAERDQMTPQEQSTLQEEIVEQ